MTLPAAYAWLGNEPGPRMIIEARRLHGLRETMEKILMGNSSKPVRRK
jgi:hypothetical protein